MVHDECSLQQRGARGLQLAVEDRNYSFDFDDVLGNSGSQEDIFQCVTCCITKIILVCVITSCGSPLQCYHLCLHSMSA